MAKALGTILLIIVFSQAVFAQVKSSLSTGDARHYLNIPERSDSAMTGSYFVGLVADMNIEDRERAITGEILSGNVPSFSRTLRSLRISQTVKGENCEIIIFTACDYLAIGSDRDYLYVPLTPSTAQHLADIYNCMLPSKKIVDKIYTNADIKLSPQPIPPSDAMTGIQVFAQHTDSIIQQVSLRGIDRSAPVIISGHKKDIIISNKIYGPDISSERVVIYGWHRSANNPIQPVYNGHSAKYADYSHGVRMLSRKAFLNGDSIQLDYILKDPVLSVLISDEGVIGKPYYPDSELFSDTN